MKALHLIALLAILPACTGEVVGDDGDDLFENDDVSRPPRPNPSSDDPEPPSDPSPDVELNACGVPVAFGSLGTVAFSGEVGEEDGDDVYYLAAAVNGALLDVTLWEDWGVFDGRAPSPGTYVIAGSETDPSNCGVCLAIENGKRFLMAVSGTVILTEVSDYLVAGSITNVQFAEYDLDAGAPVAGGCASSIAGFQMSAAMP